MYICNNIHFKNLLINFIMTEIHLKYICNFVYFFCLPILILSKPDLRNPDILIIRISTSGFHVNITLSHPFKVGNLCSLKSSIIPKLTYV